MYKKNLLNIEGASFGYCSLNPVIKEASLFICQGDVILIQGESGVGKTTFAKAMTGLLCPMEGRVQLNCKVSLLANKGLGLNPELTLKENALLRYYFFNSPVKEASRLVGQVIKFAELEEFSDKPLRLLPSLLKTRFALSLYLLARFELLVVDENIGISDPSFRLKSEILIDEMMKQCKGAVIFCRKSSPFERYATSRYELRDGYLKNLSSN